MSDNNDNNDDIDEEAMEDENDGEYLGEYIGELNINGERHGKGWAILPNGDQYDGEYKRNQRHGIGLYVFKNGARYYGRYRCGKKTQQGIFYYPDGSFYDGCWKNNLKHGYGVYTYPNGDVYRGSWHKDKRHGVGIYMYNDSDACFKGTWRRGIRVGPAEVHYPKHKFHGVWDYFHPQGPGVFSFDCKYLLDGYYRSEASPIKLTTEEEGQIEDDEMDENEKSELDMEYLKLLNQQSIPPSVWHSQNMYIYDYSKLPQHPVPLPISDSDESICDLSRTTVESSDHLSYVNEEECEECIPSYVECQSESEPCSFDLDDKPLSNIDFCP